ncbi:unnamed protein product [Gongylonema pulchrum]|uniref:TPR_REGION domain-containing protein n=1 Tax=Gongylonema pulchrum TaxID=637853 RepID=A0A183DW24_9BILA|nr:unnamed protein product [Gongylonema pulchrum]
MSAPVRKWLLLLVLALLGGRGFCFTHWMVTDDGLTIQSVSDSPYHMAQPHSLVQFLEQERKLDAIAQSRSFITEQEKNIYAHENADDPELESKIRATDRNCIMGGSLTASKDAFLTSYSLGKLNDDMELLSDVDFNVAGDKFTEEPHCTYDLKYSVYAFEHLPSVQQRENLKIVPEAAFDKLLPSNYGIVKFGQHVAKALAKKMTSASLLRLAALYWRIRGDATEAVECFRRALHFTTR